MDSTTGERKNENLPYRRRVCQLLLAGRRNLHAVQGHDPSRVALGADDAVDLRHHRRDHACHHRKDQEVELILKETKGATFRVERSEDDLSLDEILREMVIPLLLMSGYQYDTIDKAIQELAARQS